MACMGGGRVGCRDVVVQVIEVRPGCSFAGLVAGGSRRGGCGVAGRGQRAGLCRRWPVRGLARMTGAGGLACRCGGARWRPALARRVGEGLTKSVSAGMRPRWAAGCPVLAGPADVAEAWRQPGHGAGCRRVSAARRSAGLC